MSIVSPGIAAEDAVAIGGLVSEFHYLVDQGRASECIGLFAAGARLIFGPGSPNPGEIAGIEAIADFLAARQALPVTTRHLLGPPRFRALEPGKVAASSVLTLFKAPGSAEPLLPAAVADLEEIYVRTDEGWRILVREVKPVDWSR